MQMQQQLAQAAASGHVPPGLAAGMPGMPPTSSALPGMTPTSLAMLAAGNPSAAAAMASMAGGLFACFL